MSRKGAAGLSTVLTAAMGILINLVTSGTSAPKGSSWFPILAILLLAGTVGVLVYVEMARTEDSSVHTGRHDRGHADRMSQAFHQARQQSPAGIDRPTHVESSRAGYRLPVGRAGADQGIRDVDRHSRRKDQRDFAVGCIAIATVLILLFALLARCGNGADEQRGNSSNTLLPTELAGHTNVILTLAADRRVGKLLVSGGRDRTVRLWDLTTRRQIGDPLHGHGDHVNAVAISPDGALVASGSEDDTVRLWSVKEHRVVDPVLRGHTGAVTSVAFSHDGAILASAGADGTVRLWDVNNRREIGKPFEGRTTVTSLAFSPDGRMLAATVCGVGPQIWEMPDARPYAQYNGDASIAAGAADQCPRWATFSPDSTRIAYLSSDSDLRIHDAADRRPGYTYTGWEGRGRGDVIAFTPDGRCVTVLDWNKLLVVNAQTMRAGSYQLGPLSADGLVVAYSPDHRTLIYADENFLIRFKTIDPGCT